MSLFHRWQLAGSFTASAYLLSVSLLFTSLACCLLTRPSEKKPYRHIATRPPSTVFAPSLSRVSLRALPTDLPVGTRPAHPQAPPTSSSSSPGSWALPWVCLGAAAAVGLTTAAMRKHPQPSPPRRHVMLFAGPDSDVTAEENDSNPREGRRAYSPESYQAMVEDAGAAVLRALDRDQNLLQVDYPPLPRQSGLNEEGNLWQRATLQQALYAAQYLHKERGLRTHLLVPDTTELGRVTKEVGPQLAAAPYVSVGSLTGAPSGGVGVALQRLGQLVGAIGFVGAEALRQAEEGEAAADLFLVLGASAVEVPLVEDFVQEKSKGRPVILWNLELDTLRGDLGLPGFPPKDLQYRFLCRFLPVFYLRTRDYNKTTTEPPYTIDYSGALFREFPGPWQVMFKQSGGGLVCVAERRRRFTLYQAKQELLRAIGEAEEAGSGMEFARSGYKTTWFEEETDREVSKAWRL